MNEVEMHAMVLRALETCRPEIEAKQQHLVVNLDAQLTRTTGDPLRIQHAIRNLLGNAAKFTPEGGSISLRTGNLGGERFWIEVKDTGIGFAAGAAPVVSAGVQQGGRQTSQTAAGPGSGLAISRSIAEAHGGSIRGESAGSGLGATFTFELPIRANPAAATLAPQKPPRDAAAQPGMRILLVEDHRDTRVSMQYLLQRAHHRVWAAETAKDALDLASQHEFDIVVTDLGLPDQSGIELMRQLRDRFGLRGIATSGYGMDEDIAQSRDAGFVHHFTKPVSMERLRRVLTEMRATDGTT